MNKWRLMEYMEKAGHTQETLANRIGVTRTTLNNKMNGRGAFDTVEIRNICETLNITDNALKSEIFLS